MDAIVVPDFIAFTLGMIVYFIGAGLTRRYALLRNFNIPEPVSGGLAVAIVVWIAHLASGREITFELETRDVLLTLFFTTIGLNARFSELLRGGRPLAILLALTLAFMVLQNLVGLFGVTAFGLPAASAVLVGSASLIGGHGTAIAWGPEIAALGVDGAAEMGIAAATVGLILAALVGGPIARLLIERRKLTPRDEDADHIVGVANESGDAPKFGYVALMHTLLTANVAMIAGYVINLQIAAMGVKLPLFVPCLIMGILIANLQPLLLPKLPGVTGTPVLALVSDFTLSVFLSMSLMSMKLWTLAGLAGPLFAVLGAQVVLTVAFTVFVLFPAMGATYRAAVLAAGFGGFALGATPTAIANMTAVTKRYGPAPVAFIILPLVSAFFVDIANAFIIQLFASL
ncbi:sodium/glutamate symporter [Roseovarius sp. CAU 1744]|uniref:sodium/glutamate symporter n=1 Tax=Roseovarius sp. CAU 1744 TaxID=3140368 RepID=UPI00325B162C